MEGHTSSITVITPLLYAARQHKRKGRESLDCANCFTRTRSPRS